MTRSEQLHSLRVLRRVLQAEPQAELDLRKAALLHDVGKARHPLSVWQKTAAVLYGKVFTVDSHLPAADPERLEQRTFLTAALIVAQQHPAWSGEILRECASPAAVIWLAEHHQDPAEQHRQHANYVMLLALQAADRAS